MRAWKVIFVEKNRCEFAMCLFLCETLVELNHDSVF